jgi:hypothetical protein
LTALSEEIPSKEISDFFFIAKIDHVPKLGLTIMKRGVILTGRFDRNVVNIGV